MGTGHNGREECKAVLSESALYVGGKGTEEAGPRSRNEMRGGNWKRWTDSRSGFFVLRNALQVVDKSRGFIAREPEV